MDKELKAEVIKGCDLTVEQKSMINFRGMNNSEWVKNHSFNFIDGKPADKDSGLYYPICHSFSHLPN